MNSRFSKIEHPVTCLATTVTAYVYVQLCSTCHYCYTDGRFHPLSNFMELRALTPAAHSYVLLMAQYNSNTYQRVKNKFPILVAVSVEDLKEAVECVLQELDDLLPTNTHEVCQNYFQVSFTLSPLEEEEKFNWREGGEEGGGRKERE